MRLPQTSVHFMFCDPFCANLAMDHYPDESPSDNPFFSFSDKSLKVFIFELFYVGVPSATLPGPVEEKQAHSNTDPPPYLTVSRRCFHIFITQKAQYQSHLACFCFDRTVKEGFFSHSSQTAIRHVCNS